MYLQDELDKLAKSIANFSEFPELSDSEWAEFADNTVVALMAGGESSRFSPVLAGRQVQKSVFELPNGDTMMEMTIRMYRDAGIKRFAALVFHNAHTTEERLGDGSALGVEIKYSYEPEQPLGKGGAIRNALENGVIPATSNLIVVNPTDMFVDFEGSFPRYIATAHLEGIKRGMLATPVLSLGQKAPWTGMVVNENVVVDTVMFPNITVPSHVGVTLFAPEIFGKFKELFSLTEKSDFESVLFPVLTEEKKLWSAGLMRGRWIQVKDPKGYKELLAELGLV